MEAGWWTPDPRELQSGEGEEEYLIELLMGGSAVGECKAILARPPVADFFFSFVFCAPESIFLFSLYSIWV